MPLALEMGRKLVAEQGPGPTDQAPVTDDMACMMDGIEVSVYSQKLSILLIFVSVASISDRKVVWRHWMAI